MSFAWAKAVLGSRDESNCGGAIPQESAVSGGENGESHGEGETPRKTKNRGQKKVVKKDGGVVGQIVAFEAKSKNSQHWFFQAWDLHGFWMFFNLDLPNCWQSESRKSSSGLRWQPSQSKKQLQQACHSCGYPMFLPNIHPQIASAQPCLLTNHCLPVSRRQAQRVVAGTSARCSGDSCPKVNLSVVQLEETYNISLYLVISHYISLYIIILYYITILLYYYITLYCMTLYYI